MNVRGPTRAGVVTTSPHHDTTGDTTTAIKLPGGEVTAAVDISSQISSVATIVVADTAAAMASRAAGEGGEGDFKA
jgi:hypothetical protein